MNGVKFNRIERDVSDRKGIIGGSSAAAVLGFSTYTTKREVWHTYMTGEQEVTPELQKLFAKGHYWEPIIARMIQDESPDIILRSTKYAYQRADLPWMICHPDRLVSGSQRKVAVEIKSDWNIFGSKFDSAAEDTDNVPYSYLVQCLMYFWCGVVDPDGEVWLYRLFNGDLYRYIIRYDKEPSLYDELFRQLVTTVEGWNNGEEPPFEDFNEACRAIEILEKDKVREIDSPEDYETVQRYIDLRKQKKEADEEMDQLKIKIVQFFGPASKLTYRGKRLLTLVRTTPTRFDSSSFKAANPDLYDKYLVTYPESFSLR